MKPAPRLNPFPGLRPFRSDEHHLFFGREEQTAALLQLLRTNRFLAVVGTSGSGKSSLVRAGLIAELHGGTMTRAGSTWEVMLLRPGGSPLANLARAFVDAALYDADDPSTLPRLLATLNRSRFGLVEAMKQSDVFDAGTNLLVVVDQFEELFRFRQQGVDSEETAGAFVNLLLTASAQAECPIYVAITMRSDYLGDCSEIPGLAEAVNDGEYLIPRLLRDQKRDAIEKPIGVGGANIASMLVQRLLNEVGDDPDQLPVLQHALMRMWDAWSSSGDPHRAIAFSDFEATGGLGAALSNHADEIFAALPDDRHRSACERIFKALTEKGDDNRGIRRPTRLAQLQAIAAAERSTVVTVLDAFRCSGVTFLTPGTELELTDRTVLDLSHESLMRGWQRLRGWVEDEAQSARIFRRLLDTARLWRDGKASLFRDPDLQIAVSWRAAEAPNAEWAEQYGGDFATAIGFLETSNAAVAAERQAREAARQRELEQARQLAEAQQLRLEQQQRSARRLRAMIAGLTAVAVIAILACVAALIANQRANTLAADARDNARRAEQSQQETANALATVASQKADVDNSFAKASAAERLARAAEETGRKLLYTTDMRLAPFVWNDDRTTAEQLRVLLAKHIPAGKADAAKPDLRGFEWHYFHHLLETSAAVFSGHGASVVDGAFAPNGQLVTLDQNGQVHYWDLTAQKEDEARRRSLPGGPSAQLRVLSPKGRLAALAAENKVHVFDTSSGKELFSVDSDHHRARRLIFARDEDRLILVDNHNIRWLNATTGEEIAAVARKYDRGSSLAVSADGLTLAVVGHGPLGNHFSIFRLDAAAETVTPLATDIGFGGTLNAAALSPDGQRIAVGAKLSGALYVYDTTTGGAIAKRASAHASPIAALAFAGDGGKLATADTQGTIKLWADAQTLASKSAALRTLKGHQGAVNRLRFSDDGKRLLTTSKDQTARVWDVASAGAAIRAVERSSASVMARFSPDGQLLAAADGSSVRLWDAATGRLVRELSAGDKSRIHSVAFSPTDHRLLAVGHGGLAGVSYVALWDIDAATELARLPGATELPDFKVTEYTGVVGALAFSPDGKYLVAGFGSKQLLSPASSANPLLVWEVATRRPIHRLLGHQGFCIALDFSPDGTLLASGSRDGKAILWSTTTWQPTHTLQNPDLDAQFGTAGPAMVEDVAFAPDGKTLAMASYEGKLHVWDVAAGTRLHTLSGHSSAVTAVAYAPDGRTLASGGSDQTVRLWNVETRRELMQLDSGTIALGGVSTLAFSPDGKQLLVGGRGDTAFWSAAPVVWSKPGLAADKLRVLLHTHADFPSRIRMFSENLRLHEALAKLDANDWRVQAALAAAQANWQASRQAWPEAARAFDRLLAVQPTGPAAWLRTPGLLRVAMALLQQQRPTEAAMLLQGGAARRAQDGLPPMVIGKRTDEATGELFFPLLAALEKRLAEAPRDAGLLELRAELNRQETDLAREVADYTAVIQVLTAPPAKAGSARLRRLYRRRSDAYFGLHKWAAAVADYSQVITAATADVELLSKRARAHEALKDWQAATADWSRAVAGTPDAAKRLAGFGRRLVAAGQAPLARATFAKAQALYEQWHRAAPNNEQIVADLAQLLLDKHENGWTVLRPAQLKSKGGATLTLLDDGSILASGVNPNQETYTVVAPTGLPKLTAIRLEALVHESLVKGGPGRSEWGNFALSRFAVTAEPLSGVSKAVKLKLVNPRADFEQVKYPIAAALDGKPGTAWSIDPQRGKSHAAIFAVEPAQQTGFAGGTQLTCTLDFQFNLKHALGCFRLSVSGNPATYEQEKKRLAAMALTDPWLRLAVAYVLDGRTEEAWPYFSTALKLTPDRAGKARIIAEAASLSGVLEKLAERTASDGLAQAELARHFAVQRNGRLAEAARTNARALLEERLSREPENTALAAELAQVLRDIAAPEASTPFKETTTAPWVTSKVVDPWTELAAAYALSGNNDKALQAFNTALQRADGYDVRKAIFARAARFDAVLSALLKQQPDDPQLRLALARTLVVRGTQRLADKQPAQAQAELAKARTLFTQVRAKYPQSQWTVLGPTEMKNTSGRKMELQADGSVYVPRSQGAGADLYSLVFQADAQAITGLRLEALADDRLPGGGPGTEGHFVLNELTLQTAPADSPDQARTIALRNASADFSLTGWDVRAAIDGIRATGWDIPQTNKNYTAVFDLAENVGEDQTAQLTVQLYHQYFNQLGRFRLAVTNDPATLLATRVRLDVHDRELADLNVALGRAYALSGRTSEAVASFTEALRLAADRAGKATVIAEAAPLDGVLEKLAERAAGAAGAAGDGLFQAELARHYAARGQVKLADAARATALAYFQKRLAKEPANATWPAELANLLISSTPAARDGDQKRFMALKLTNPWLKLAAAYALNERRAEALQAFSKALDWADRAKDWQPIFAAAAGFDDFLTALVQRPPDEPRLWWGLAQKRADRGKQRLAQKQPAQAQVELEKARAIFTRIRATVPEQWTILTPATMATQEGATLTRLHDQSILAAGKNPHKDVYVLTFRDPPAGTRALRLEVMPHESLPQKGPGRSPRGNFVLTTIKAQLELPAQPGRPRQVRLARAWDDHSSNSDSVPHLAIDGEDATGWATLETGKPHFAVFELARPLAGTKGAVLCVTLEFQHYSGGPLGRFRLSVARDAQTLQATRTRLDLKDGPVLDLHLALARAYAQQGQTHKAVASFTDALQLATGLAGKARLVAEAARCEGVLEQLVPHLAQDFAAHPNALFSQRIAALQAWFGQDKELATSRQRILAFAKGTNDVVAAERAALACSIRPSTDKAELAAALALGRTAVKTGKPRNWGLLALGMAEYRSGNYAAADAALLAAEKARPNEPPVTGTAAFYRALSLFRQGKRGEARTLASRAAAKMKPLPKDKHNPLAGTATYADLILWLAYQEARDVLQLESDPAAAQNGIDVSASAASGRCLKPAGLLTRPLPLSPTAV